MLPGTAWPRAVLGEPGEPLIRVRIVAREAKPFTCRGNVPIAPHTSIDEAVDADVICVPNITIPVDGDPNGRYPAEVDWLNRCYAQGATIMSVCSGALLLAEAGLLDGEEATAHWAYKDMFRKYYPKVSFQPERVLSFAGEAQRLVLAGGMSSWHDLALYLISRHLGLEQAIQVSKFYLLDSHENGQLPYAALSRRIQKEDRLIEECQHWLADHYPHPDAIQAMQKMSGLPQRTFTRRFKASTGYTPVEYVQAIGVEEAKQLLETSHAPVEEVANQVGYSDERAFRRIFGRNTGLSPSAYRKKFNLTQFNQNR